MYPMPPSQSWAIILLLIIGAALLAKLLSDALLALPVPAAGAPRLTLLHSADPDDYPDEEISERPTLRLIQGGKSPTEKPAQLYDWAVDGI